MKILVLKKPGAVLVAASDLETEKLNKFKTEGLYEIEIKRSRNPKFHRKVFAFFNFCFEHWRGSREFLSQTEQFDVFRKNLTVTAGFYNEFFLINGNMIIEPMSLSYSNMSQEKFEECYSALINAAMKHVFHTTDENTYNRLLGFF